MINRYTFSWSKKQVIIRCIVTYFSQTYKLQEIQTIYAYGHQRQAGSDNHPMDVGYLGYRSLIEISPSAQPISKKESSPIFVDAP